MFDISSAIISKVELMPQSMDYFYVGVVISTILSILPAIFRFCNTDLLSNNPPNNESSNFIAVNTPEFMLSQLPEILHVVVEGAFGSAWWYLQKNHRLIQNLIRKFSGNALWFW